MIIKVFALLVVICAALYLGAVLAAKEFLQNQDAAEDDLED